MLKTAAAGFNKRTEAPLIVYKVAATVRLKGCVYETYQPCVQTGKMGLACYPTIINLTANEIGIEDLTNYFHETQLMVFKSLSNYLSLVPVNAH